MTAVRVRNLSRSFGHRPVLRDVDLDLDTGEFVAIVGASGSGKSTLLRILAGLDGEASGEVEVSTPTTMVFQDPRLLPWLSVLDNVVLGLPRGQRFRARTALAEVGLRDHAGAWPKTLSGGEAQRVALARALVREPRLLLLDEPFSSLDALTRMHMHHLIAELHRIHRPGTLLVTHDIDEALALADRVLVLDNGTFTMQVDGRAASRPDPGSEAAADPRETLLAALGVITPRTTSDAALHADGVS